MWKVLDNVYSFTGDDWDSSIAQVMDDLVADTPEPSTEKPVVEDIGPEGSAEVCWDSDSAQLDSEEDLDSHHSSQCSSPRPRPSSLVQLQDPTPAVEREGPTTPLGGGSIGPSTSVTHAPGRGLKRK